MKKITVSFLLMIMLALTGCSEQDAQETKTGTISPNPATGQYDDTYSKDEYYIFDVSKEWDTDDFKKAYGQELSYFSAPILSPYKYTYKVATNDLSIEEIANKLGEIMMEDFMLDYEGKTFIVTEYKDLAAHVMNKAEYNEWVERYQETGKNIKLMENQWICTFSCNYKYSGVYAGIGEMPSDWEWMNTLVTDGSGENHVFIIQLNSELEYIMRAMPKTVMEVSSEQVLKHFLCFQYDYVGSA